MLVHLRKVAEELGLPFGERTKTYNSRLAQELGLWAEDQGKGDDFHMAAFYGYFADGLNLAQYDVLIMLAKQVGLPENEAEMIVNQRRYRTRVDQDWAESRLRGISAVPTFLMGQHKLIGAQDYKTLVDLVTMYGVSRKTGD